MQRARTVCGTRSRPTWLDRRTGFFRTALGLTLCFLLVCGGAFAAIPPRPQPQLFTSASRQVSVRGLPLGQAQNTAPPGADLVLLDPALLAVSSENIKESIRTELGWSKEWQGRIHVELHPARGDNERMLVNAIRSADAWNYRIEMPDEASPDRVVYVLVEVFLTEFANRRAGDRSAELPPWLATGLAAHLQSGPLALPVLSPNRGIVRTRLQRDPLEAVRERLALRAALTVDQLNWPPDLSERANAEHYKLCAQLFVRELLRLRDGPRCMREMLKLLPEHLNWQTAFLRGFQPHFQRMLDVEKWWALVLVSLNGRDTSQIWPLPDSLQRLDDLLFTPVQVRLGKDDIPHESQVSLQTVLAEWDYPEQAITLQKKLIQFGETCPHLDPEVLKLAKSYRKVIEEYLAAHDHGSAGAATPKTQTADRPRAILMSAVSDLNVLDRQREKMWKANATPKAKTPPSRGAKPGSPKSGKP